MSTSAKTLPERASVEFLRTESRDLHRAFQAGEPKRSSASPRICRAPAVCPPTN